MISGSEDPHAKTSGVLLKLNQYGLERRLVKSVLSLLKEDFFSIFRKMKKKQRFVHMHTDVHVCKYCPVVRKDPESRKWRKSSSMHTYRKSLRCNREVALSALMRQRLRDYFSEKSFFAQCHLT